MKNFWVKLSYFVPIIVFVGSINFYMDPNRLFHNAYLGKISEALLNHKNVQFAGEFDYCLLRKKLIEGMSKPPEVVILGSSRATEISSELFPHQFVANDAIPAGAFKEMVALVDIYQQRSFLPRRLVLEVDPWILKKDSDDTRWCSLYDEYYNGMKFIRKTNNQTRVDVYFQQLTGLFYRELKWFNLFSPAYFKLSLHELSSRFKKGETQSLRRGIIITEQTINQKQSIFTPDGCMHRSLDEENISIDQINSFAQDMVHGIGLSGVNNQDAGNKKDFKDFLACMVRNHVEVQILLVPLHPLTYQQANLINDNILDRVEVEIRKMAEGYGIRVIGSYDPKSLHLTESDFIDGVHPKVYVYSELLGK